jgi:hypothetical protein
MEKIQYLGENPDAYHEALKSAREMEAIGVREMTEFEKGLTLMIRAFLHDFLTKNDIEHSSDDLSFDTKIVLLKTEERAGDCVVGGRYKPLTRKIEIYLAEHKDSPYFLLTLIHEAFHSLSHSVLTLGLKDVPIRDSVGLTIKSKNDERLFGQLDEAFTQYLTDNFIDNYLPKPILANIERPYEKEKDKLFELMSLIEKGEEIISLEGGDGLSGEEIEKILIRAYFSGEILPLARLFEKHFGKGWFRKIGKAYQN